MKQPPLLKISSCFVSCLISGEVTFLQDMTMPLLGYFYILTNTHNTVLYCGATNDLYKRVLEHRNSAYPNSFTLRYNINKLVYFEVFSVVADAFQREKQIKAGSRKKKINLVNSINEKWEDLFYLLDTNGIEDLIRLKKFLK